MAYDVGPGEGGRDERLGMCGGVKESIDHAHVVLEDFIHLCICVVVGRWLGIKEIAGQKTADMRARLI